ncbi:uncharacterized protein [Fopius arisanus]|uniref:Uncharacterized protein n=1 Tax=Fopius arisanus TaxID=64838 RepID=A0A9R1T949_9HYME|nr:PREDICTED: uncharacterized protein LOC105267629 [Fopius arisanus]
MEGNLQIEDIALNLRTIEEPGTASLSKVKDGNNSSSRCIDIYSERKKLEKVREKFGKNYYLRRKHGRAVKLEKVLHGTFELMTSSMSGKDLIHTPEVIAIVSIVTTPVDESRLSRLHLYNRKK